MPSPRRARQSPMRHRLCVVCLLTAAGHAHGQGVRATAQSKIASLFAKLTTRRARAASKAAGGTGL